MSKIVTMVDLETLSTTPRAVIISIRAVLVDLEQPRFENSCSIVPWLQRARV